MQTKITPIANINFYKMDPIKLDPDPVCKIELEMCSCCLNSGNLINMQDIVECESNAASYYGLINTCYNFPLLESSDLLESYYICELCANRLVDSFLFRCQVIKAQETILSILKESEFPQDSDIKNDDNSERKCSIDEVYLRDENDSENFTAKEICEENGIKEEPIEEYLILDAECRKTRVFTLKNKTAGSKKKLKQRAIASKYVGSSRVLEEEIRLAMDLEKIQCRICHDNFLTNHSLSKHMNSHFKNYTCEECGKGFATMKRLRSHMFMHKVGSYKCADCDRVFSNYARMSGHRAIHRSVNHVCPHCSMGFKSFYTRQKHLLDVHNDCQGFLCKYCGYLSFTSGRLSRHIQTRHTVRQRQHACNRCDKNFLDKATLKKHLEVHTATLNYKCDTCELLFSRRRTLVKHLRLHTRNFLCTYCGQKFVNKRIFTWHVRRHEHEADPHKFRQKNKKCNKEMTKSKIDSEIKSASDLQ